MIQESVHTLLDLCLELLIVIIKFFLQGMKFDKYR